MMPGTLGDIWPELKDKGGVVEQNPNDFIPGQKGVDLNKQDSTIAGIDGTIPDAEAIPGPAAVESQK